MLRKKRNRK